LRHCGKYVYMKRYHCPHLGPDYPFAAFKWDSISLWQLWGNLTVTLSHVYSTVVHPLSCMQKVRKRLNLHLQGEDCGNTIKKGT